MINARVRVTSDGGAGTRVYLVPEPVEGEEAGETLHLPVRHVALGARKDEPVIAQLEVYVAEFDVHGVDNHGRHHHFTAKPGAGLALHHHLVPQVDEFVWRYAVNQRQARVSLLGGREFR